MFSNSFQPGNKVSVFHQSTISVAVLDGDGKRVHPPQQPGDANRTQPRNHDLKNLFKSAATTAAACPGALVDFYENLLRKGMRLEMARLTLARKIAAMTLQVGKIRRTVRRRVSEATSRLSAQERSKRVSFSRALRWVLNARVRG